MNEPARQPSNGAPRWAQLLLRVAGDGATDAIGDLHEIHRRRVRQWGRPLAVLLTTVDAIDVAWALRRAARSRAGERGFIRMSALDFTLGLRMLRRYPALTAVAVLTMAFGIAGGAAGVEFVSRQMFPPLPYRDADRIVGLEYVDKVTGQTHRTSPAEFSRWEATLRGAIQLSAYFPRSRAFSVPGRTAHSVSEVAVSTKAFGLLRDKPFLGRPLDASDELPNAPPVAVISHALWKRDFAESVGAIGARVRIGGVETTVVGVMGEHFAFFAPRSETTIPPAQDLWIPLRSSPADDRDHRNGLLVFGRLNDDVSVERLRAEYATALGRLAADSMGRANAVPRVLSFPRLFANAEGMAQGAVVSLGTVFLLAIMVILCANVALLLFARAAVRERELAIRNALGASRARIVGQLFAESFVLAGVAAVVGLFGASLILRWANYVLGVIMEAQGLALPGWLRMTLSPATIAYAVLLALVGAIVTGILPGVEVTSGSGGSALAKISGTGAGVRIGGIWTRIIVVQVVLTAVLGPLAFIYARQSIRARASDRQLPHGSFLRARVEGDDFQPDVATVPWSALKRSLATEPWVASATFGSAMPGSVHPIRRVSLERGGLVPPVRVQVASVDQEFFTTMGARLVAGRKFVSADTLAAVRPVIVNSSFVTEALGGRYAIGQRLRFATADNRDPPMIIVGVVGDLPMNIDPTAPSNSGMYLPLSGNAPSLEVVIETKGPPELFASSLRELIAAVAPATNVARAIPLDQAGRSTTITYDALLRIVMGGGLLAILLSNAGIYAVISCTVTRRTREIGIRVALGATPRQIASAVLSRMLMRVTAAVVVGTAIGWVLAFAFAEGSFRPKPVESVTLIGGWVAMTLLVCMAACVVPLHRALSIEPKGALGAET